MDNTIVLDCGSDTFKAGYTHDFPSEEEPRVVTPAAFDVNGQDPEAEGDASRVAAAENGAAAREPSQLMHTSRILQWEGFQALLSNILYQQLGWQPGSEGSILFSEPLFFSKADREQLTQLFFEYFNVDGLFLADAPVLALYSIGKLIGSVIDIGHGKTDVSVILDGQLSSTSVRRIDGGMSSLTALLERMLAASQPDASLPQSVLHSLMQACIHVPEDLAYAASQNGELQPPEGAPVTHTLPDGQTFTLAAQDGRQLGEALLNPALAGLQGSMPLADALASACSCHLEAATRKAAMESILLCGGGSAVPGLGARLLRDVRGRIPASTSLQLLQPPDYMPSQTLRYASWLGGAVLSKVVFAQNQHINKFDYDEVGPPIVHRKCI